MPPQALALNMLLSAYPGCTFPEPKPMWISWAELGWYWHKTKTMWRVWSWSYLQNRGTIWLRASGIHLSKIKKYSCICFQGPALSTPVGTIPTSRWSPCNQKMAKKFTARVRGMPLVIQEAFIFQFFNYEGRWRMKGVGTGEKPKTLWSHWVFPLLVAAWNHNEAANPRVLLPAVFSCWINICCSSPNFAIFSVDLNVSPWNLIHFIVVIQISFV